MTLQQIFDKFQSLKTSSDKLVFIVKEKPIIGSLTLRGNDELEDEDLKPIDVGPTLIERMKKLGYIHRGSEDMYEQFTKSGKNYRIHKYKKDSEIELEK